MRWKLYPMIIAMVFLADTCPAQESLSKTKASQLIGGWQKGLSAELRALPEERRTQIFLENILVFKPDHSFYMYPKCGQETAAYKARGLVAMQGEWEITKDGFLKTTAAYAGNRLEQRMSFEITEDDLKSPASGSNVQLFGRYTGPLPPKCPL